VVDRRGDKQRSEQYLIDIKEETRYGRDELLGIKVDGQLVGVVHLDREVVVQGKEFEGARMVVPDLDTSDPSPINRHDTPSLLRSAHWVKAAFSDVCKTRE
ncbi:hypothetical protein KIPB_015169, partial [Kipferlia bialata]